MRQIRELEKDRGGKRMLARLLWWWQQLQSIAGGKLPPDMTALVQVAVARNNATSSQFEQMSSQQSQQSQASSTSPLCEPDSEDEEIAHKLDTLSPSEQKCGRPECGDQEGVKVQASPANDD